MFNSQDDARRTVGSIFLKNGPDPNCEPPNGNNQK